MRLEFDLDEDAWDEEVFSRACNRLFEELDATSCYFGRMDPPLEDPDAGVLGSGNSAYTAAEGGEVNSVAATIAQEEATAEVEAEAAQAAQDAAEEAADAEAMAKLDAGEPGQQETAEPSEPVATAEPEGGTVAEPVQDETTTEPVGADPGTMPGE